MRKADYDARIIITIKNTTDVEFSRKTYKIKNFSSIFLQIIKKKKYDTPANALREKRVENIVESLNMFSHL